MTAGTGNFAELLWPGIKDIFGTTYDSYPPLWTQFFTRKDSDQSFEKAQGIATLPRAGVKSQGEPIPMIDPLQGYQKEFVNVSYAIGSSITLEMYQDDRYDIINGIPSWLAESLREAEEIVHHDVLNNGFTTQLTADGVSLFNTAHPMIGTGTTLSNMGQSGVTYALSQTSLEQVLGSFISKWTDDQDKRKLFRGVKLVVPSELMFTAEKLLGTEYEVGTGNNTINPVRGRLNLIATPYLTDTDSWFVITDVTTQKGIGLRHYDRMARDLERDSEFTTRNMLFSAMERWSCGAIDWRGAWGSSGA